MLIMIASLSCKFFHSTAKLRTAALAVDKNLLSKLRKTTGYSISHCKKALQLHENNFDEADKWLAAQAQAQGWAKATKLAGRSTSQGLLGVSVSSDSSHAALMELNCETDFVARNSVFKELAQELTQSCLAAQSSSQPSGSGASMIHKELWNAEQVSHIMASDGKTLGDKVALSIGLLGENMSLSRALKMWTGGGGVELYAYTHPPPAGSTVAGGGVDPPAVLLGKFAAIVTVRRTKPADLGVLKQLCLQVIGMNPECIGTEEDLQKYAEELETSPNPQEDVPAAPPAATGEEEENTDAPVTIVEKRPKDKFLLQQEWLDDEEFTVKQILDEAGIEVLDFIRVQVGEKNG
ncbi:elongation factor Ts, mitochondrial [Hyalella azteca]|uniref:Elongation factor Ts, mitochondrial n=1 Tax=Hyalella azteca TaxID=294128 RepID=A0A8B7PG96_HYAAZ|nr:elongation factor Ts, mitochondrial [Hyalella azteca]